MNTENYLPLRIQIVFQNCNVNKKDITRFSLEVQETVYTKVMLTIGLTQCFPNYFLKFVQNMRTFA